VTSAGPDRSPTRPARTAPTSSTWTDPHPGRPRSRPARTAAARTSTRRSALQLLEQDGLVTVRPRRGRIVRSRQRLKWNLSTFESPESTTAATADAWGTDVENQGHDPAGETLHVERITPPPDIAAILHLEPTTDTCVVRRHIRYIDGAPAIISDDYFDLRLVEGTELAAPEDTTREDILKDAGYEQTYDVDEIIVRMPTPTESERLHIEPGTPVAEHRRVGFTATDRPVRLMISVIPGDTIVLRYVVAT
jgi:GntR family transcriptional regulator